MTTGARPDIILKKPFQYYVLHIYLNFIHIVTTTTLFHILSVLHRPYVKRITNNRQILFDCDRGYNLRLGEHIKHSEQSPVTRCRVSGTIRDRISEEASNLR